jgi:hypothetical protein
MSRLFKYLIDLKYRFYVWVTLVFPIFFKFDSAYWYITNRFKQTHMIDTGMPKGVYSDIVEKMLYGMMQMVEDYVSRDKENAFSIVDFMEVSGDSYHQETKNKIIEVLHFKNIRLFELEEKLDQMTHEHCKKFPIYMERSEDTNLYKLCVTNENDPQYKIDLNKIREFEIFIENEKQRILHQIVDIRNSLWS